MIVGPTAFFGLWGRSKRIRFWLKKKFQKNSTTFVARMNKKKFHFFSDKNSRIKIQKKHGLPKTA